MLIRLKNFFVVAFIEKQEDISLHPQFSSVAQSCPTLWPHGLPGLPLHHQLPKFTQTDVRRVGDAIQPSHPLRSTSPAFNVAQHQGIFQWVSSLHQVAEIVELQLLASVLPMNIQDWFPLGLTGLISMQSKGLSRVFSNTTVQKHQFLGTHPSLWSNPHIHTWLLEKL